MSKTRILFLLLVCLGLLISAVPAGQNITAGANQSDDPCYKIKQMKEYIRSQAGYRKAVGDRDPAYIQCHPLMITVLWELEDTVHWPNIGTDTATLILKEEYPASLMLHYGWFDKLQKKELQSYEILGPEPCQFPCPGRAKAELSVFGQVICCMDIPSVCAEKRTFELSNACFQVVPADAEHQRAHFRFLSDQVRREGKIVSSRLARTAGFCGIKKSCSRFWDPFEYELEIDGTGIDSTIGRKMCDTGLPTPKEILEGVKAGEIKKVYDISSRSDPIFPGGATYILKGTVTVTMSFAPAEEERWRVTAKGWETPAVPLLHKYKDRDGKDQLLRLRPETEQTVTCEFVLRKVKSVRSFKEGSVTDFGRTIRLIYQSDVYDCKVVTCQGQPGAEDYRGVPLEGEVTGQSVRLILPTPKYVDTMCVFCKPIPSYLKNSPYRDEFDTAKLLYALSKEALPLKNGYTKTGKEQDSEKKDYLRYTITLTKLK